MFQIVLIERKNNPLQLRKERHLLKRKNLLPTIINFSLPPSFWVKNNFYPPSVFCHMINEYIYTYIHIYIYRYTVIYTCYGSWKKRPKLSSAANRTFSLPVTMNLQNVNTNRSQLENVPFGEFIARCQKEVA